MKILIKIILLFFVIGLIIILIPSKTISQGKTGEPLVSISNKATSGFSINIREEEKNELKAIVKRIESFVYKEATIHNPPGDMLPDQIDNNIIKEVKEKVN